MTTIIKIDESNRLKLDIRYNKELKPFGITLVNESKSIIGNNWQGFNSFFLDFKELEKINKIIAHELSSLSGENTNV